MIKISRQRFDSDQVPIGVFSDFPETEPLNSNRGSGADHTAALTQAGLVPLGADAFSS